MAFIILFLLFLAHSDGVIPLKKSGSKTIVANPSLVELKIGSLASYGSPQITETVIRKLLGAELETWLKQVQKQDPDQVGLELKFKNIIKNRFSLAMAEWSIVHSFVPSEALHIILDTVEKNDKEKRMPFYPPPTGKYSDPDGLIEGWIQYEDTAFKLMEKQEIVPMEAPKCKAFHCPFGHIHPRLKPFEAKFVEGVKKNQKLLSEILANDSRTDFRGASAYLLPYMSDGSQLLPLMVNRIRDPEPLVRNNALRVIAHLAQFHQNLSIPIQPILEALDYPRASDRSKALIVLHSMVNVSSQYDKVIKKDGLKALISLLKAKLPAHTDVAYAILKKVSKKSLPQNNVLAWEKWALSL